LYKAWRTGILKKTMNRISAILLPALVWVGTASSVNSSAQDFTVTERGANCNVLQKTTIENGTNCVHRYTELATGLNYTNASGQWVESKEQISILPNGTAAATNGQHKVYFPSDIYEGVLEVVTPDGRHLKKPSAGCQLR
jgi:archaellum component FlaF (FlaF/FlaG flagellin family)